MTIGDRLRSFRIRAGFSSAKQAAERFGWKPSTYASHENGQTPNLSVETATKYASAFRVTAADILIGERGDGVGDIPKLLTDARSIPEIDVRAGAGGGGLMAPSCDFDGSVIAEESIAGAWQVPDAVVSGLLRSSVQHIRAFEVVGDSMEPRLSEGDRVFVDTRFREPHPEGIFVLWDGYGVVVKSLQIVRGTDPARLRVISVNPRYETYEILADEAKIIGRFAGRFTTG